MNANEPAYPHVRVERDTSGRFQSGLTKREAVAISFHAALLSTRIVHLDPRDTANLALKHADALLTALEKK